MPNYKRARYGTTFFFTVVTFERNKLFNDIGIIDVFREIVRDVKTQHPFDIDAWVVLPEHMHCLWTLPDGDMDYSRRWSMLKRKFTQRWDSIRTAYPPGDAHTTVSRIKRREGSVWQRRFWEHQIRDERDYRHHCDYIHYNPVKHGLVNAPVEWPYSTFHRFVQNGLYEKDWGACDMISFPEHIGKE
ncbi:MAG: transposase [Deltaproteobacteria bacterium]|nr:transposase [Deltaproteobacteria bacterium]